MNGLMLIHYFKLCTRTHYIHFMTKSMSYSYWLQLITLLQVPVIQSIL